MIGKNYIKLNIMIILIALIVGSSLINVFSQEKVYKLTFVSEMPGMLDWDLLKEYTDLLNNLSNGRLDVTLQAMGSIVPATQEFDAVNEGIIDITNGACAWGINKVPTASLFSGPVGGMNDAAMDNWLAYGGGQALVEEAFYNGYPNIIFIADLAPNVGEVWGYSKVPIETPEDIKGLRMRCMGDAGEIFNRMGASVIFLPGGEIYEALSRGIIDWAEWAAICNGWDFGFQELTEYMYFSNSRAATNRSAFIMNKNKYNSLPDDLKLTIKMWATSINRARYNLFVNAEMETIPKIREFGVKMLRVPASVEEAFLKEAEIFYKEKCEKDPFFATIYNSQMDFKKKYNELESLMFK